MRRWLTAWAWTWACTCFVTGFFTFTLLPWAYAAGPALPQRNLSVEARIVEQSAAERQALAGGGSVVVGTGGSSSANGGVTFRAGSNASYSDAVQRVLVLNGGQAMLRLSQLTPLRSAAWLWFGPGAGLAERSTWVDVGQGLAVRPVWPGGKQPVRLDVAIESIARNDLGNTTNTTINTTGDATAPRLSVQTQVSLPLGDWVTVAQLSDDSSGNGAVGGGAGGASVSTRALRREMSLQLRVTVP